MSCLSRRWGYNTPPDSPGGRGLGRQASLRYEGIIPELDIYAIPSQEGSPKKEIYFVALIDVLTHYGVKKQVFNDKWCFFFIEEYFFH